MQQIWGHHDFLVIIISYHSMGFSAEQSKSLNDQVETENDGHYRRHYHG